MQALLDKYRQKASDLKEVGVGVHLPAADAAELLQIAKVIDPNYTQDLYCDSCVEELVLFVYANEEKLTEQPVKTKKKKEDGEA